MREGSDNTCALRADLVMLIFCLSSLFSHMHSFVLGGRMAGAGVTCEATHSDTRQWAGDTSVLGPESQ